MNPISSINFTPQIKNTPNFSGKVQNNTGVDRVDFSKTKATEQEFALKRSLNLVKSSLMGEKADQELFKGLTLSDWIRVHNFTRRNGLSGLVLDGVNKNPELNAPKEIVESLETSVSRLSQIYERQETALGKFIEQTSKSGIDTVQMKGIGLSMDYPNPKLRFGSDIDIFSFKHGTDPSLPNNNASFAVDKLAKDFASRVDTDHGPKHSVIYYERVPFENHRTFLNIKQSKVQAKLNDYLLKHLNPREQILSNGTKILVPSPEFNTVFLGVHSMQHYICGEINMHQLVDWSTHINKHGLKIPKEVKGTPLEDFMYALTSFSNKYLGTNVDVPKNEKLEQSLYNTFMNPITFQKPKSGSVKDIIIFKLKGVYAHEQRKKELFGEGSFVKTLLKATFRKRSLHDYVKLFTKYR